MSHLADDGRELLEAARRASEPDAADRARVRAGIARQLAVAAGAAGVATAAAARAGAAPGSGVTLGGGGATVKLVVALVVLGAGAAIGYERLSAAPERLPAGAAVERLTTSRFAPVEAPELALPGEAPPPPASAPRARPPRGVRAAAVPEAEAAPVAASSLAAEVALLARARTALRRRDAAGALAALDEHAEGFPAAELAEEAAALRVRALCAAGRAGESRAQAAKFLARWPDSVQATGVGAACASSPPAAEEQP